MSPRTKIVAAIALVGVAVVVLWNLVVFAPKGETLDDARARTQRAELEQGAARAELEQLEQLADQGAATRERITELETKIPASAELDTFIREADAMSDAAGVELLSVTPSPAQEGSTALREIRLTMQLRGRFRQVLDYLRRVETAGRLVVVDAIEMSAESETAAVSGGPPLDTTVQARMFVQSEAAASAVVPSPDGSDAPEATTTTIRGASA